MEMHEAKPLPETADPKAQSRQIIADSQNIYLIAAKDPEAITSTLALFYTLKNLNKNVNLIADNFPENLKFLTPALDFVSYPKNFVIAVPNNVAQVSQIYYEKNNDGLKIYLTLEKGNIKKENILFYFAETKPDLIITVGIKDYSQELSNELDSFGFLLDSPILNIDGAPHSPQISPELVQKNKRFGKINVIDNFSLPEIILNLIKTINKEFIQKELASCLLCGMVLHTENFKNKLTAEIFQTCSELMRSGANIDEIVKNIYKV